MNFDTLSPARAASADALDRQVLHAIQLDPRLPFSRIAAVLGVSDQTVARRYRGLRSSGVLRVVSLLKPWQPAYPPWFFRMRCVPDAAEGIATALARRPDTGWVHLLSGGAEIDCTVLPTDRDRDQQALLLQRVTRTNRVVAVTAHAILRMFAHDKENILGPALTPEQVAQLRPDPVENLDDVPPEPTDRALFAALARDARAPLSELARATGWSESAVRRRLDWLRRSGLLRFEAEIEPEKLGLRMAARLWITAEPAKLAAVGEAMSRHVEVPFVAATTGATNLVATAFCRDAMALYDYLSTRLGTLDGIRHVESAPVTRTIKRGPAFTDQAGSSP